MSTLSSVATRTLTGLDLLGAWIGLLSLRLLLGWDYFESGLEKRHGSNWFDDIRADFPWPFHLLPTDLSWSLATGFELVGGLALVLGLGTRFFALSLLILTWVATVAAHWPAQWQDLAELMQGYVFTDRGHGNFKLPVLLMGMLLPLLLLGAGRFSLDYPLRRLAHRMKPSFPPPRS